MIKSAVLSSKELHTVREVRGLSKFFGEGKYEHLERIHWFRHHGMLFQHHLCGRLQADTDIVAGNNQVWPYRFPKNTKTGSLVRPKLRRVHQNYDHRAHDLRDSNSTPRTFGRIERKRQ